MRKYEIHSKADFPSRGTPCPVWRVVVPRGLKTEDLEAIVRQACEDAFTEQAEKGKSPGAVRVFAFQTSDDYENCPTAATGTLSKDGGWGKSASVNSLDDLSFMFEMAPLYLDPSIYPCAHGDFVSTGSCEVHLSASCDDWSESTHVLPPGTEAQVLEIKRFTLAGQAQMFRVKVRRDDVEGWADSTALNLSLGELD